MKYKNKPESERKAGANVLPVRERRYWDDDIMHTPRVQSVMRGRMTDVNMRRFDGEHGDYETFCRVVQMLGEFYKQGGTQIAYRDGILYAARLCQSIKIRSVDKDVLNAGDGLQMLSGVVYVPYLVAWCAVCHCKGASSYDCEALWKDEPGIQKIISVCFISFDKLDGTCYTDNELFQMKQQYETK